MDGTQEKEADLGGFHRPDDILLLSLVLTNPISQMETIRPEEAQQFTQMGPSCPRLQGMGSRVLARGVVYSPGSPQGAILQLGEGWGFGPDGFVLAESQFKLTENRTLLYPEGACAASCPVLV